MLLGRERERQELDRLLASARSGRSAVLGLVGEPGIGKTALLDYAAEHAGRARVLRARGIDSETNVPFAALFELLRPTLGLLERTPQPQADALRGALALGPGTGADRFAVGAATLSLLAACAEESPLLMLLDDAHLLDGSSAAALLFALRRLLAEPIGAVVAVRESEPSLLDGADLPTLRVGGLDRGAAAELLGGVADDVAERLYRATAGNPLALLELRGDVARLPAAPVDAPLPVPATLARVFAGRVQGLADGARSLLLLLAASDSGELGPLERAAAMLGLDLAELDTAEQAGLIRREQSRLEFRHPLARAAVYTEAPPQRRRDVHRALADALPDRELDRRAWHLALAAAGADEAASSALEQAATRAHSRSAYAVASTANERAARLTAAEPRRCRLLLAGADAAWLAGLADRAIALLDEAGELASDREQRVEIEHLRGHIATRRGPVMEGHAILAGAAELAAEFDREIAVTLLAESADACFYAGDARELGRVARRGRELLPPDASARARFLTALSEGMALVFGGEAQAGIASIRDGVELAESSPELGDDAHLLPWLVMGPLWLREARGGRAPIASAIASARARTEIGLLPRLLNRIARMHAATASWSEAAVAYDEAIRLAREAGQQVELAAALAGLAWLQAREGREDDCREHAEQALTLCGALGVGLYATWALRALGELELGLGRAQAAAAHLEAVEKRLQSLGIGDVDLSPAAELVEARLRLGLPGAAAAAGARLEREARAKGQPWSRARAARCRGLLADEAEFEAPFEEALRLGEQTPDVFETARTRLAYGARLRRERRRLRAREELRAALATFDELGATPWSEQALGELAATGQTARRRDPSTLDDLTPQELQIARLLAAGRTTREAAAALFLSPKTIEYHLRSVYRKLGVNSRPDLAKALTGR